MLESQGITDTPLIDIEGYISDNPAKAVPLLVASTMDANVNEFYRRDSGVKWSFDDGTWSMPDPDDEWDDRTGPGWWGEIRVHKVVVVDTDGFQDHYGDWWVPRP
ncbi:MAG: hypothetical protein Q7U75_12630, partial [Desulfobacterales bacterium]|nr:hypothetical protein [Desulfobacterales bacterium]